MTSRRKHPPSPTAAANSLVRKLVRRVSRRSTPTTLYHYTSGAGLIGILETRSIWATDIRFLNDTREFQVALDLVASALDRRRSIRSSPFMSALHQVLGAALETASRTELYVSSLSEQGDQLSQWRGYCPTGNGYAIGVTPITLIPPDSDQTRFLVACIYDKSEHEKLVDTMIDDVLTFADTFWTGPDTSDRTLRESFKLFQRVASLLGPALKDPTFSEEAEWRLVSVASSFPPAHPSFRPGRSTLIPYFAHPLGDDDGVPLLDEIVVGPTPYPDLAKHSVEGLLRRHGISRPSVRTSTIPFRDW
jgi:hypothetical protein